MANVLNEARGCVRERSQLWIPHNQGPAPVLHIKSRLMMLGGCKIISPSFLTPLVSLYSVLCQLTISRFINSTTFGNLWCSCPL